MLHYLPGVRTEKDLWTHPKYGASWEGYVIEESLKAVAPEDPRVVHGSAQRTSD